MAPIQDVPPELILHICSFLRTEYEGKELIGGDIERRDRILQGAKESRRTLFNFSATCKTYRSMSVHELQGSIEVFGSSEHGISASPMTSRLVSLLQHAHTGAMNPKSVRQLSISFEDNAIAYHVFDDEIATINRMASSMSLQLFQAPMWQRFHERGWTISHHHFAQLFAQLVVMLLLNFKSVRHLTLQLSTHILQNITEFASQTIPMPQQDWNKNNICQLLTLQSLAMGTDPSDPIRLVAHTMPQIGPGFGALFSWDVGAEVFLMGFAVKDALAGIAPNLGSIALNYCFISKSQLHQVLNRCQALEKFIFIAPAGYSLPSPGDTIDMCYNP
ncbi:hypothetical protein CcaCcLH18_09158 [Colletotrichum camelliae]|nr:hypothetical protein CcaCcLH18_09158 [Colletotrichum camelliae]